VSRSRRKIPPGLAEVVITATLADAMVNRDEIWAMDSGVDILTILTAGCEQIPLRGITDFAQVARPAGMAGRFPSVRMGRFCKRT
jgi:hypothetical protein